MANINNMVEYVGMLQQKKIPYLIIKYNVEALLEHCVIYEIITIGARRLVSQTITRAVAVEAIEKYHIPLLYKANNHNMIWGDEDFKSRFWAEKCKRRLDID